MNFLIRFLKKNLKKLWNLKFWKIKQLLKKSWGKLQIVWLTLGDTDTKGTVKI